MRKIALITCVSSLLLAAGCFSHEYVARGTVASTTPAYDSWHHHFLFALINASGEVDLDRVCPGGVARIENEMSFLNGLTTVITGALYQPTTVRVYCSASAQAHDIRIDLDQERVARLRAQFPNLEERLHDLQEGLTSGQQTTVVAGREPSSL